MNNDFFQKTKSQNGIAKLVVGADYIKLIWVPDTFFVNEKTAQFHAATQVSRKESWLELSFAPV